MTRTLLVCTLGLALSVPGLAEAPAGPLDQIAAANRGGNVVFLVLTDMGAAGTEQARELATAAQARVRGSAVVELVRGVPSHTEAVKAYRLQAAPVPLVLLVAQNGIAVGAVRPTDRGALERLVTLVPSPAKAEYFRVLSQKRLALVVFSRPDMPQQSPLFEALTLVNRELMDSASMVLVDLADPAEARFAAEWKIPPDTEQPVVAVVNPMGQILGRLEGAPTAAEIIEVARRKAPCCSDPGCTGCK